MSSLIKLIRLSIVVEILQFLGRAKIWVPTSCEQVTGNWLPWTVFTVKFILSPELEASAASLILQIIWTMTYSDIVRIERVALRLTVISWGEITNKNCGAFWRHDLEMGRKLWKLRCWDVFAISQRVPPICRSADCPEPRLAARAISCGAANCEAVDSKISSDESICGWIGCKLFSQDCNCLQWLQFNLAMRGTRESKMISRRPRGKHRGRAHGSC